MTARIICTHTMDALPAAPERVFPALCPVREAEWLPGWTARLLWSRSGFAEEGALFLTPGLGGEPWIWHIVRHDPASGEVRFSVAAPGSHHMDLALKLEPARGGSRLHWTYTLQALGLAGEAFLRDYEAAFPVKMALLERRLRHWLATGTMLLEGAV